MLRVARVFGELDRRGFRVVTIDENGYLAMVSPGEHSPLRVVTLYYGHELIPSEEVRLALQGIEIPWEGFLRAVTE
jgi:hypothetical protein